ncbi:hypothetical protein MPTK1_8g05650 [Marchantia polymorpha subsp. ruderalis]
MFSFSVRSVSVPVEIDVRSDRAINYSSRIRSSIAYLFDLVAELIESDLVSALPCNRLLCLGSITRLEWRVDSGFCTRCKSFDA